MAKELRVEKPNDNFAIVDKAGAKESVVFCRGGHSEALAHTMAQAEEMREWLEVYSKRPAIFVNGKNSLALKEAKDLLAACEPPKPMLPAGKLAEALGRIKDFEVGRASALRSIASDALRDYKASEEATDAK